jgi:hypothetical protein
MIITPAQAVTYIADLANATGVAPFKSCWFLKSERDAFLALNTPFLWVPALYNGNETRIMYGTSAKFAVLGEDPCPAECPGTEAYDTKKGNPDWILHVKTMDGY